MRDDTYFVEIIMEDGTSVKKVLNSTQIIKYTNEKDFNGISELKVYLIKSSGSMEELKYKGWQPNCLIEYISPSSKEVIIRGYGEDH